MDEDEGDLTGDGEENERDVHTNREDKEDGVLEQKKGQALTRSDGQGADGDSCSDGGERDGDGDARRGDGRDETVGDRGRGRSIDEENQNESLQGRAARMEEQSGEVSD